MQESRLFKIIYHLLNNGHVTAPELAEKLEVSVRTIYRDIEALSEAGIPVYAEIGRGGEDFSDIMSISEKNEFTHSVSGVTGETSVFLVGRK